MSARSATLFTLAMLTATALATPPQLTVVVQEDDVYSGGVGTINLIDNVAVNGRGDWLVEAYAQNASTSRQVLLRNGQPYILMGPVVVIDGITYLTRTLDSVRINDAGDTFHNVLLARVSDPTGPEYDSLWFNQQPILLEGDVAGAPELPSGTVYVDFIEVYGNDRNQILFVGKVDHPSFPHLPGADWLDHYVLVRLDLEFDATGRTLIGFSETCVLKQGDPLGDSGATLADIQYLPHTTTFNDAGDWVIRCEGWFPDDDGTTPTMHDWMVVSSNGLLLQEGDPSPLPGRNHQFLDASGLDLNNRGMLVHKTNLDGSLGDDEAIFLGDRLLIRESDTLPAIAPATFTSVGNANGPVDLADTGDVLWVGTWQAGGSSRAGLFRNHTLVIAEQQTVINGRLVVDVRDGRDAYELSDNGRFAIVRVKLDNSPNYPLDAAVLVDFGPPAPARPAAAPTAALSATVAP